MVRITTSWNRARMGTHGQVRMVRITTSWNRARMGTHGQVRMVRITTNKMIREGERLQVNSPALIFWRISKAYK